MKPSYSDPRKVAALKAEITSLLNQLPLEEKAFETKHISNLGTKSNNVDCEEAMLELAARRLRIMVGR